MRMTESERRFHRKTAAQCFNKTWDYLEKKRRNADDDAMMLHLAHTSRYHWSLVGVPRNQAVGDWQISRVYAAVGQPSLSLQYAKSSLAICKKNRLSEVLANAYEAVARAYAVAKNYRTARSYLSKARKQLGSLNIDDEDRKFYLGQIRETEKMIRK
jgi:tetratricopeptide (TPR) repeat protein